MFNSIFVLAILCVSGSYTELVYTYGLTLTVDEQYNILGFLGNVSKYTSKNDLLPTLGEIFCCGQGADFITPLKKYSPNAVLAVANMQYLLCDPQYCVATGLTCAVPGECPYPDADNDKIPFTAADFQPSPTSRYLTLRICAAVMTCLTDSTTTAGAAAAAVTTPTTASPIGATTPTTLAGATTPTTQASATTAANVNVVTPPPSPQPLMPNGAHYTSAQVATLLTSLASTSVSDLCTATGQAAIASATASFGAPLSSLLVSSVKKACADGISNYATFNDIYTKVVCATAVCSIN